MAKEDLTRLVKPYAKGQITIPADFRERLGIDENSILQLELKGSKIEITHLKIVDGDQLLREYDDSEIEAFLEEDKIDKETADRVRELLGD
ncbi:MAG: AbrB/MazE/SpoVT family DNA-binding domain-containing protein [Anaerolineales bacterium]|nr:AbrB/MazE/SpoVT family DNA-binding domain-containing protein [Anaerolineales bacterium]